MYMETKYEEKNCNHKDPLQVGSQFQDFVSYMLSKEGIIIQNYSSNRWQREIGENIQGFEIKYDAYSSGCCMYKDVEPSGRVGIETEERTNTNRPWVPSGILRDDNSWLYIVGNYKSFWIFSKKDLLKLYDEKKYPIESYRSTLRGYYIPIDDADDLCLKKYTFNEYPEEIKKIMKRDMSYNI